jgi:hypothetical protein
MNERFEGTGLQSQEVGSCLLVPGSWLLVLGSWFLIPFFHCSLPVCKLCMHFSVIFITLQ